MEITLVYGCDHEGRRRHAVPVASSSDLVHDANGACVYDRSYDMPRCYGELLGGIATIDAMSWRLIPVPSAHDFDGDQRCAAAARSEPPPEPPLVQSRLPAAPNRGDPSPIVNRNAGAKLFLHTNPNSFQTLSMNKLINRHHIGHADPNPS